MALHHAVIAEEEKVSYVYEKAHVIFTAQSCLLGTHYVCQKVCARFLTNSDKKLSWFCEKVLCYITI